MTEHAHDPSRDDDPLAADALLTLLYDELRRLATARLAAERPGQTLGATALVHEAYLRLNQGNSTKAWQNRAHFFAAAAEAMRRILIEKARRKAAGKHGGGRTRVDLDAACSLASDERAADLLALDDALSRLATESAEKAQVVKLRFFAGLTMRETAEALGISLATAERHWAYARSWLFCELGDGQG